MVLDKPERIIGEPATNGRALVLFYELESSA